MGQAHLLLSHLPGSWRLEPGMEGHTLCPLQLWGLGHRPWSTHTPTGESAYTGLPRRETSEGQWSHLKTTSYPGRHSTSTRPSENTHI